MHNLGPFCLYRGIGMEQKLKADLSRTAILEAAVREFGVKPFEKASINQICRDGNITKGRMYHYFDSKDQLYIAAEDHCLSLLGEKLLAFTPNPEKPMEDNILAFFLTWQNFWKAQPSRALFMARARLAPPEHLREATLALQTPFRDNVLLKKLQEIFAIYFPGDVPRQRMFADISNVAISYIAIYLGATDLMQSKNLDAFFDRQLQMFRVLVHIFLHGCMGCDVPESLF